MNNGDKQYLGTRWLSLAVVLGIAAGTVIGRFVDNMRVGLMIGLALAICVWTLITQRRTNAAPSPEGMNPPEDPTEDPDKNGMDE